MGKNSKETAAGELTPNSWQYFYFHHLLIEQAPIKHAPSAPYRYLDCNSEEKNLTFCFQKQVGIQGRQLMFITITDEMVNKTETKFSSVNLANINLC